LRRPTTRQEEEIAREIARDLGYHALALDIAGRFLLKTTTFRALSEELRQPNLDPLGELVAGLSGQLPGGHEKSIVRTLLRSIQLLEEEGLNVLRLACELDTSRPIPCRLAIAAFGERFHVTEGAARSDVAKALNQLEQHSLAILRSGDDGDIFVIHALTAYTMRRADPAGADAPGLRATLRSAVVRALAEMLPEDNDLRVYTPMALIFEHARALSDDPRTLDDALLCSKVAGWQLHQAEFHGAKLSYCKAAPILEATLGNSHQNSLRTRGRIAVCTLQLGRPHEALPLFWKLLPLQINALGAMHIDVLATRANILSCLLQTGRKEQALNWNQTLLRLQREVLGPDNRDTLATRGNIAQCWRELGYLKVALRHALNLLSDTTRVLGAGHQDALRVRFNVAGIYFDLRKFPSALEWLKKLLPDQESYLGADHPDTRQTRALIERFRRR
jgi:tetratricopeptide (TPR) repeat protein